MYYTHFEVIEYDVYCQTIMKKQVFSSKWTSHTLIWLLTPMDWHMIIAVLSWPMDYSNTYMAFHLCRLSATHSSEIPYWCVSGSLTQKGLLLYYHAAIHRVEKPYWCVSGPLARKDLILYYHVFNNSQWWEAIYVCERSIDLKRPAIPLSAH